MLDLEEGRIAWIRADTIESEEVRAQRVFTTRVLIRTTSRSSPSRTSSLGVGKRDLQAGDGMDRDDAPSDARRAGPNAPTGKAIGAGSHEP